MRTSQRLAALAAVDVAVLVLAATLAGGSTDRPTAPQAPKAKPASARQAPAALTPAGARKLAAAGVLRAGDLPGFAAVPADPGPEADADDRRFYRCMGFGKPAWLARDHGTRFMKGGLEVDSAVDVVTSASVARKELAALAGGRTEACMKEGVAAMAARSGTALRSFSLTPARIDVKKADAEVAHRLTFVLEAGDRRLEVKGYLLAATVGPAELSLTVLDPTGAGGLTLKQATRLLAVASGRTRAAL